MADLNNGLIGLSLLSGGTSALPAPGPVAVESRAVRLARSQFTLAPVTPPWSEPGGSTAGLAQVNAIRALPTIIDRPDPARGLPSDVASAFVTYKALDRLRVLAERAADPAAGDALRKQLQTVFAKGLGDLQSFLADAPSDKLTIGFAHAQRQVDSVAAGHAVRIELPGRAVVRQRADGLSGLAGTEVFTITLRSTNNLEKVTLDLSRGPQPPTLDSVTAMLNAAISSIPRLTAEGGIALNPDGDPIPKWRSRFETVRQADGWGLQLNADVEQVAIDRQGAPDALLVTAGQTSLDAPTATAVFRFDDPAGALDRRNLATLAAVDPLATAEAALTARAGLAQSPAPAPLVTRASVTDAQGFAYLVGSTPGDLGSHLGNGRPGLVLTKLGSDGSVVWQRSLGAAGSSDGAAISLSPAGGVVVAGTVTGAFGDAASDGDLLVARYDEDGSETYSTLIRSVGADSATAIAALADGSVVVGGRSATGGALLARLDAAGAIAERRAIAGSGVRALQRDDDGSLLVLTQDGGSATLRRLDPAALASDQASLDLGPMEARALAVANGRIAVGGTAGGDGIVKAIDAALGSARTSAIASDGLDQVDSLAFLDGQIFAGGRTSGLLGERRIGASDAFVARLDPADGTVLAIRQWGRPATRTEPVTLAVAAGGADQAVAALGLRRGWINPPDSARLTAQTSLRPGDRMAIRVDGGAIRSVTIAASDTLASLVDKLQKAAGPSVPISAASAGGARDLRIAAAPGHTLELLSGPDGRDALAKLGLEPQKLIADPPFDARAPRVRPGGKFSLDLSLALNLADAKSAGLALDRLRGALSVSQTAFRSLYWDDNKAALANGAGARGAVSPYQSAQLARYQDALTRLGG